MSIEELEQLEQLSESITRQYEDALNQMKHIATKCMVSDAFQKAKKTKEKTKTRMATYHEQLMDNIKQ